MKKRRPAAARGAQTLSLLTDAAVRAKAGRALRTNCARSSHAAWSVARRGRDVIAMLEASNRGRVASLVPIRYGRMLHSPFAFLRGAAAIMAYDLAHAPHSGIRVQAAGDAHLMNFGGFATPERHLVFDVNDFDETLPAPWEWDLKRLVASVVVAGRYRQFPERRNRQAALAAAAGYRAHMARYAQMATLELWYQRIDAAKVAELHSAAVEQPTPKRARHANAGHLYPSLIEVKGETPRFREDLPLLFRPNRGDRTVSHVPRLLALYRATLPADRRALLERFELVDFAMKVVGVGSVGTRCAVLLLKGADGDALILQLKEARASVLEPYAGSSRLHHGERVVAGQRLMQAASDPFLGWSTDRSRHVDFYVRQLRDCKSAANIEAMNVSHLEDYSSHCGAALARAHAKSGDAAAISGYIGKGDALDLPLARFACAYADQNERDFETLQAAAKRGLIAVEDA